MNCLCGGEWVKKNMEDVQVNLNLYIYSTSFFNNYLNYNLLPQCIFAEH